MLSALISLFVLVIMHVSFCTGTELISGIYDLWQLEQLANTPLIFRLVVSGMYLEKQS